MMMFKVFFLNRVVRDHGKIDLEWLRDAPPEKSKVSPPVVKNLSYTLAKFSRIGAEKCGIALHHSCFLCKNSSETGVGPSATVTRVIPTASTRDVSSVGFNSKISLAQAVQVGSVDIVLYELHY